LPLLQLLFSIPFSLYFVHSFTLYFFPPLFQVYTQTLPLSRALPLSILPPSILPVQCSQQLSRYVPSPRDLNLMQSCPTTSASRAVLPELFRIHLGAEYCFRVIGHRLHSHKRVIGLEITGVEMSHEHKRGNKTFPTVEMFTTMTVKTGNKQTVALFNPNVSQSSTRIQTSYARYCTAVALFLHLAFNLSDKQQQGLRATLHLASSNKHLGERRRQFFILMKSKLIKLCGAAVLHHT